MINIPVSHRSSSKVLHFVKNRASMFLMTAFLAMQQDTLAHSSVVSKERKDIITHRIASTIPVVASDKLVMDDGVGFIKFSDGLLEKIPDFLSPENISPMVLHDLYVLFTYYKKGQKFLYDNMRYQDNLLADRLGLIDDDVQFMQELTAVLFSYGWEDSNQGHSPVVLQQEEKMLCLGKTLLAHVFLTERGIEHYSLALAGHSALFVVLDGQLYYMDPTYSGTLYPLTDISSQKDSWIKKLGLKQYLKKDPVIYDPEMGLFAEMLINQGLYAEETKDMDLALLYYHMAILANPDSPYAYFNAASLQEQYGLNAPVFRQGVKEIYRIYDSKKKDIWKKN